MQRIIHPRQSQTREGFITSTPAQSIALDGYVLGWPKYNADTKHINFDHHTGVERLATRSTMGQVMMAIKQWLFDAIDYKQASMYINDADQDVCLSTRLLQNYTRVSGQKSEPLLNKIIEVQDKLDCTSGMYPFDPNYDIIQKASRIFDPYIQSRMSGRINTMDVHEMANVIDAVHARIDNYLLGNADRKELDTRYDKVGGWRWRDMVKEIGYDARIKMAYDGIKAFVSIKESHDGKYNYSIGKLSEYIAFPIQELYTVLNVAEKIPSTNTDRRNGGTTIGWSPRNTGSSLSPKELERVINTYIWS